MVDDDPDDRELTISCLTANLPAGITVEVARDGVEALDYVYRRGAFKTRDTLDPNVILLDLKMPRIDGHEVLRAVKGDPSVRHIPVVAFTSSEAERDIRQCYESGANGFMVKHIRPDDFRQVIHDFAAFWCLQNRSIVKSSN
ncbi:response regulator [Kineosporia sp. NBRC 101731]|uniref:response regulator n=1 Tax=Kineosporia sp. NBRC 101731 TaxID=3032199 RepID=UPI002552DC59|nr:response regulator [Kineosporia sp. NBRC 101731]